MSVAVDLVKVCGGMALAAAAFNRLVEPSFALDAAPRLKLVNKAGKPIKAGALEAHANYIFNYPYVSTPCLLLRLGAATPRNVTRSDAEKAAYTWPGGVGKDGAVVAYMAICAHGLSYDGKKASFITYHKARSFSSQRRSGRSPAARMRPPMILPTVPPSCPDRQSFRWLRLNSSMTLLVTS